MQTPNLHWLRPSQRQIHLGKVFSKLLLKTIGYAALLLAASNPPKAAFVDFKVNQLIDNTIHTPINSQCTNLPHQIQGVCQTTVGVISTGVNITQSDKLERYISGATQHKNYVLFSIYTIKLDGLPSNKTLGVMGQLIPLEGR